jgi:hypothetical protein
MRWPPTAADATAAKGAKLRRILFASAVLLGLAGLVGIYGPRAVGAYRLAFPPDTDAAWESKVGWRLCNGAIAAWPTKPAPNCDRLRMCDNEGGLTEAEHSRLNEMMAATRCED